METAFKPSKLVKGDSVALVNPTGKIPERFSNQVENSFKYLMKEGYNPRKFLIDYGASKEERAEMFNQAIVSSARALFPVGDSKGTKDILDLVDYREISRKKPILAGFSSLSSLLNLINQKSDLLVFYGPHMVFLNDLASFKENNYTIASFWNIITGNSYNRGVGSSLSNMIFRSGNNPLLLKNIYFHSPNLDSEINFEGYESGFSEGRLLASSLEGLVELSEEGYEFNDRIVITDSLDISFDEAIQKVKLLLDKTNINKCSAIIISSLKYRKDKTDGKIIPELCSNEERKQFVNKLRKMFKEKIPILYGFPSGHGRYKLTIPIGLKSSLDLRTGDVYLKEPIFD